MEEHEQIKQLCEALTSDVMTKIMGEWEKELKVIRVMYSSEFSNLSEFKEVWSKMTEDEQMSIVILSINEIIDGNEELSVIIDNVFPEGNHLIENVNEVENFIINKQNVKDFEKGFEEMLNEIDMNEEKKKKAIHFMSIARECVVLKFCINVMQFPFQVDLSNLW